MKSKETGENMSFFSFPMGRRAKGKRRRSLWVGAIRRQGFVPTQNTKVCSRHFVSGIAISDPSSVDYIPTVNMKSSVTREEQRQVRKPDTGLTVT